MEQGQGWVSIDSRTWRYEETGVRFFLLTGDNKALLIDSGMTTTNALDLAREITGLPLALFNTHCDPDHIASNAQFDQVLVSPMELVHPLAPKDSAHIRFVWDGDVIDLGNRELEAIALPGHTPGSTALLDRASGMLFSGDPIQRNGRVYLFGPMRNIPAYIASLIRLKQWEGRVSSIWPSHAACPIDFDVIDELIAGAQAVERNEAPYQVEDVRGATVWAYDAGPTILLCDPRA